MKDLRRNERRPKGQRKPSGLWGSVGEAREAKLKLRFEGEKNHGEASSRWGVGIFFIFYLKYSVLVCTSVGDVHMTNWDRALEYLHMVQHI